MKFGTLPEFLRKFSKFHVNNIKIYIDYNQMKMFSTFASLLRSCKFNSETRKKMLFQKKIVSGDKNSGKIEKKI